MFGIGEEGQECLMFDFDEHAIILYELYADYVGHGKSCVEAL